MIPCTCGGNLYRKGYALIKSTGEEKLRYVCKKCGATVSYYRKDGGEWEKEKRPAHRPITGPMINQEVCHA